MNWDDPHGRRMIDGMEAPLFRFSKKEPVEFFLEECQPAWEGLHLKIKTPKGKLEVDSALKGRFQSENILAALAAGWAMGISPEGLQKAAAAFEGAPGRMETIANDRGIHILVDYAHTPEALSVVLDSIRELRPKRLITVFGCGGGRDRGKRPLMGKIASQRSDVVVVTSDNPRREDPKKIVDEILTGIEPAAQTHSKVERKEAIALALELARPGDCVLIAGKGHETTQEIGGEKRPFDDREAARELLAEKK